jgi:hypothetical protein
MKHLTGALLRAPVLWLPLIGAAYSRARERTCDRHGGACSGSPEASVRALGALAAGKSRWRKLNVASYVQQAQEGRGFWMSFHELLSGYPWLTRRAAFLMGDRTVTRRNPLAYVLALFMPYGGRLGPAFAFLMLIYVVIFGVVGAIAAQEQLAKVRLATAFSVTAPVREALANHYTGTGKVPASLEQVGIESRRADGLTLSLNPRNMQVTVTTQSGELILVPADDGQGHITWSCTNGSGVKPEQLPAACSR